MGCKVVGVEPSLIEIFVENSKRQRHVAERFQPLPSLKDYQPFNVTQR